MTHPSAMLRSLPSVGDFFMGRPPFVRTQGYWLRQWMRSRRAAQSEGAKRFCSSFQSILVGHGTKCVSQHIDILLLTSTYRVDARLTQDPRRLLENEGNYVSIGFQSYFPPKTRVLSSSRSHRRASCTLLSSKANEMEQKDRLIVRLGSRLLTLRRESGPDA